MSISQSLVLMMILIFHFNTVTVYVLTTFVLFFCRCLGCKCHMERQNLCGNTVGCHEA